MAITCRGETAAPHIAAREPTVITSASARAAGLSGVLAIAAAQALASQTQTVEVRAEKDATVSRNPDWGGPGVPLGGSPYLYAIHPNGYRSAFLLDFDLSALAGATVVGQPVVRLVYEGMAFAPEMTYSVQQSFSAWSEDTVTWSNFGWDVREVIHYGTIVAAQHTAGDIIEFPVSAAIVQSWIDAAGANHGLLVSARNGRDLAFISKDFTPSGGQVGDFSPSLVLTVAGVVPEPSSIAMMMGGLVGLTLMLRRRRPTAA